MDLELLGGGTNLANCRLIEKVYGSKQMCMNCIYIYFDRNLLNTCKMGVDMNYETKLLTEK